ncbi:MAG: hypothetical protein ACJA1R_002796, partial [Flavobacteriales bacterium]
RAALGWGPPHPVARPAKTLDSYWQLTRDSPDPGSKIVPCCPELMRRHPRHAILACAVLASAALSTGCADDSEDPEDRPTPDVVDAVPTEAEIAALWEDYEPPPPAIPRLTVTQRDNALLAVFGDDIVIPRIAWADEELGGLESVGAATATIPTRTGEEIELAARAIAEQALSEEQRDRWMPCAPADALGPDTACATETLRLMGRRAWRRPLTDEELTRLVGVSDNAADVLDSFYEGMTYGLAGLIQSPHFLFRREIGTVEGNVRVFSDYELASRLSFLVWNTTPDDALLDAAEAGELSTDEGLRAQLQRLIEDERAREGVLNFFVEWFRLDELYHLTKDPLTLTAMSAELGPAAREETLRSIAYQVFDEEGDYRELLTTNRTFVNGELAALYGVQSPSRDGFEETYLPPNGGRRGLLGQASYLLLHSHPTSSSPTLRGLFIREAMLCMPIGAPPAGVDTSIPEPSGTAPTLRDRVAEHLEDENCSGCHLRMDPIGLAFESFDGIARYRERDNGVVIDPSGALDGEPFEDSWEIADIVASHERFGLCVAQTWMRYATSQVEQFEQLAGVDALTAEFERSGYRILDMVEAYVMSPAFRTAGMILAEPDTQNEGAGQ